MRSTPRRHIHAPRTTPAREEGGFMMVAMLIGMAIAAIWMTAALPSWRVQVQRTREANLIFRGEQYARAIMLYQDKNRGALPSDIDTLVSQHYLRKKWKDPVTNDDFVPVGIGIISQSGTGQTQQAGAAGQGRAGGAPINTGGSQAPGITGVRSKSSASSIKVYQNQQQYNLWQFDAALYRQMIGRQTTQQGPAQGAGDRGGRDAGPGGAAGRGGVQPGSGGVQPGRGGDAPRPGAPPPPAPGRGRGGL